MFSKKCVQNSYYILYSLLFKSLFPKEKTLNKYDSKQNPPKSYGEYFMELFQA